MNPISFEMRYESNKFWTLYIWLQTHARRFESKFLPFNTRNLAVGEIFLSLSFKHHCPDEYPLGIWYMHRFEYNFVHICYIYRRTYHIKVPVTKWDFSSCLLWVVLYATFWPLPKWIILVRAKHELSISHAWGSSLQLKTIKIETISQVMKRCCCVYKNQSNDMLISKPVKIH